jgi:hypothetical protein
MNVSLQGHNENILLMADKIDAIPKIIHLGNTTSKKELLHSPIFYRIPRKMTKIM